MNILLWVAFVVFILLMLALDLGVLSKGNREISTRKALTWTLFCVVLALGFNVLVYFLYEERWLGLVGDSPLSGSQAALQFFTGWLIEQSLSLDNIFVFAMIFTYFRVPSEYKHRVLFWGVVGALIMRGIMIALGAALLTHFSWTDYLFGALLLFAAIKMLRVDEGSFDPEKNPLLRIARRLYPVTKDFDGEKFFTHLPDGRRAITPLFLVLIVIESSDVLFAVDSIPAVFAVTKDPFLVFTSNIFAILNLRSLYFVLAAMLDKFEKLKFFLVMVLVYVAIKMILGHHVEIPVGVSLVVIVGLLLTGVVVSITAKRKGN